LEKESLSTNNNSSQDDEKKRKGRKIPYTTNRNLRGKKMKKITGGATGIGAVSGHKKPTFAR